MNFETLRQRRPYETADRHYLADVLWGDQDFVAVGWNQWRERGQRFHAERALKSQALDLIAEGTAHYFKPLALNLRADVLAICTDDLDPLLDALPAPSAIALEEGERAYWKLSESLPLDDAERLHASIVDRLGGQKLFNGWHPLPCSEVVFNRPVSLDEMHAAVAELYPSSVSLRRAP